MTENEMKRMQQEAVKRAKEMQNKSRNEVLPNFKLSEPKTEPPKIPKEAIESRQSCDCSNIHNSETATDNSKGIIDNIFDVIMKDKEKTLILCLIIMLMDEKNNYNLLIALIYLLI